MTADECMFYHPEGCLCEIETGAKCEFWVDGNEYGGIFCRAENEDLKPLCAECQENFADAEFPLDECCKSCAAEIKKDDGTT